MPVNGITVIEAVEWRDEALDGGSQAQVFRLTDGRFAVVKFPENGQGEKVHANEFLSCQLAEMLDLPVNRAVMVSVDERLLRTPRQNGRIPPNFSAGIRCGMIRFANAARGSSSSVRTRRTIRRRRRPTCKSLRAPPCRFLPVRANALRLSCVWERRAGGANIRKAAPTRESRSGL